MSIERSPWFEPTRSARVARVSPPRNSLKAASQMTLEF